MPKSFSIDLKQFTLYRPIGNGEKVVKRRVDRADIIACLNELGYNNIDERGMRSVQFGVIPCLDDIMAGKTLGIPASAQIHVRAIGRKSDHLLLTFTY